MTIIQFVKEFENIYVHDLDAPVSNDNFLLVGSLFCVYLATTKEPRKFLNLLNNLLMSLSDCLYFFLSSATSQ